MNGYWEKSSGLLAALAALDKDKNNGNAIENELLDDSKAKKKVKLIPPKKVREKLELFNANFTMGNIFQEMLGNLHN